MTGSDAWGVPEADRVEAMTLVFGTRLRALRKAAGMTQTDLAACTGIRRGVISDYERSHHMPSVWVLDRLTRGLGTSIVGMFEGHYPWDDVPPVEVRQVEDMRLNGLRDRVTFREPRTFTPPPVSTPREPSP